MYFCSMVLPKQYRQIRQKIFDHPIGNRYMVVGIIAGVAGMVLIALAYPVYNHVLKHERKRIAPEILRLTDELMK